MPISDPPPGMMKSNPDAGTMSLSGTMNKAISAGKALEVEAEVAAERYTYSIANTGEIEVRVPLGRAAGKREFPFQTGTLSMRLHGFRWRRCLYLFPVCGTCGAGASATVRVFGGVYQHERPRNGSVI